MSPPRDRPLLDPSIIRRPGHAAPVSPPSYVQPDPAPDATAKAIAPAPASVAAPAPAIAPSEKRPIDNMPWLSGRPWTRKLGIRVDEDRVRRIKIAAAARGTTMEALLVEAIDEHMSRHWPEISRGLK